LKLILTITALAKYLWTTKIQNSLT